MEHVIKVIGTVNNMFGIQETKNGGHKIDGSITCDGHVASFYKFMVTSKSNVDLNKFASECTPGALVAFNCSLGAETVKKGDKEYSNPILWVNGHHLITPGAKSSQMMSPPQQAHVMVDHAVPSINKMNHSSEDLSLADIPF